MSKVNTSYFIARHYAYDKQNFNGTKEDWILSIQELFKEISDTYSFKLFAYVLHDSDIDDNGNKKEIHFHALVRFCDEMKQEDVQDIFNVTSERNCQVVKNMLNTSRYLIHISDSAIEERKHIYKTSDVVMLTNESYENVIKASYWSKREDDTQNAHQLVSRKKAEAISDDLANKVMRGEISKNDAMSQLKVCAGSHYIDKYRHKFNVADEYFINSFIEHYSTTNDSRNLTNIYISGLGGLGKSTLAKLIGLSTSKRGVYVASSDSKDKTFDALDGYSGQSTLILNEVDGSSFSVDEFNNVFDPHQYSPFPSRNHAKHFVGNQIIMTNSVPFTRFVKNMMIYDKGAKEKYQDAHNSREIDMNKYNVKNKYFQIRRRFKHVIHLERDEKDINIVNVYVFTFSKDTTNLDGSHYSVQQLSYRCESDKKPEFTEDFMSDLINALTLKASCQSLDVIDFIDNHKLDIISGNEVIDAFVDEYINEFKWDLLPTSFLYDLYKVFRLKSFASSLLMNVNEFSIALQNNDVFSEHFEYKGNTKTSNRMDANEPLVNLIPYYDVGGKPNPWMRDYTNGFRWKPSYKGFLRK